MTDRRDARTCHAWTRYSAALGRHVFDAEAARAAFAGVRLDGPHGLDGYFVARWEANGAVPPADCLADFYAVGAIDRTTFAMSERARKAETAAFLDAYRRAAETTRPSDELRAELRAEYGPDAKVVDVITGRRIEL